MTVIWKWSDQEFKINSDNMLRSQMKKT
jgi:hypothetical protein